MIRLTSSLILAALSVICAAEEGPTRAAILTAKQVGSAPRYLGARSCSATACHANISVPQSPSIKDGEFIYWLENDPHALALETLENDRSVAMLRRLGIRNEQGRIVDLPGFQNCLACHNVSTSLDQQPFAMQADGVSCESCHGAAGDWIDQHYTNTWAAMTIDQKSALGFRNTYDLGVRAAVCVTCHVGAPDREVNHDIIAAGHPPLKFEMSAFHDLLPKHWNHDGRGWPKTVAATGLKAWPERTADFEMTLWRKGREEAAKAALRLLAHRARNASKGGVWPELAEYDCFSCHHELKSPSWRQLASRKGRLQWGNWYFANSKADDTDVNELRNVMEASLSADIDDVIAAVGRCINDPHPRFEPGPPTGTDWDSLAQSYLASVARRVAQLDAKSTPPNTDEDAVFQLQKTVRLMLSFPPEFDSPQGQFDQGNSLARSLDPQTIQRRINDIFSSLGEPAELLPRPEAIEP